MVSNSIGVQVWLSDEMICDDKTPPKLSPPATQFEPFQTTVLPMPRSSRPSPTHLIPSSDVNMVLPVGLLSVLPPTATNPEQFVAIDLTSNINAPLPAIGSQVIPSFE